MDWGLDREAGAYRTSRYYQFNPSRRYELSAGGKYATEEVEDYYRDEDPVRYSTARTREASMLPLHARDREHRGYYGDYKRAGYGTENGPIVSETEFEPMMTKRHSEPHMRGQPSTQQQIEQLKNEREQLMNEVNRLEGVWQHYTGKMRAAASEQTRHEPQSPEYQKLHQVINRMMEDMYAEIGSPEEARERVALCKRRLTEIEEQLSSFKKSRFQPLSSPEGSEVSGRDGSRCSPPLSHTSDPLSEGSLMTDASSLPPHHLHPNHHQLIMQPSQNESGYCDDQSDVTGTSLHTRKNLHSPYNSTGVGSAYSSENSSSIKVHELPQMFQSPCFRSASYEDNAHDHTEPAEVLASLVRKAGKHNRRFPYSSLSQDTYSELSGGQYSYYSPMSLSQRTDPQLRLPPDVYPYPHHHHHHKPGSPASSETSSLSSSIAHRLGSNCASEVSFTTTSSSKSNPNRLPRPQRPPSSSQTSSSSSNTSLLLPKSNYHPAPSHHDYVHRTRSEVSAMPPYIPGRSHPYDYDTDECVSMPALPTMKGKPVSRVVPMKQPHGAPSIESMSKREREMKLMMEREVMLREMKERGRRHGRRKPQQPRIPEEDSQRDSLSIQEDIVRSIVNVISSSRGQSDASAAKTLFDLSQAAENCAIMRQMGCLGMLVSIIHRIEFKGDKNHLGVRQKAAAAMRKLVEVTGETKQGKYETCTLSVLEKFRTHCDQLWDFIYSYPSGRSVASAEAQALQEACDTVMSSIRKLYKYSTDKDHYRPSVLTLGGIQATAELLIVNYRLITAQRGSRLSEKPICHSSKAITVIITILINLTYGDVKNKSALCHMTDCLKSLMFHLRQQSETITASGAQVLRNLSWHATPDIKEALLKCNAGETLMSAIKHVKGETTIQHITSALWNLSAHSVENRHKICSSNSGIQILVELLSYNSPSGTTAIVENVGGILKNLSVVIMQAEGYRRKFREVGGLDKLVQHLKSKNKTVLANATGILWNLSARCPEDQKHLWDLGCVPLLDVLQSTPRKVGAGAENNISECARGALRNLLAFGQTNGWTSRSDVGAYNLKTQRGLSKSLSSSANYAFALTQPSGTRQSDESLSTRHSQPLPKNKGSDSNVAFQQRSMLGSERRHLDEMDGQGYPYASQRDYERDAYLSHKSKLAFARVPSAPLANQYVKEGAEFMSYMPNPSSTSVSPYAAGGQVVYHEDGRRRKGAGSTGGRTRPRGRSIPFSLSQSESYHLSSNSELHSVEGASYGFSPNLSNEPSAASLSALDSKLESFDPHHLGGPQNQEVYDDLDVEVDENYDIDNPVHHANNPILRDGNQSESFIRSHGATRRGSAGSVLRKSGTSSLALDGTTSDQDIADRDEQGDEVRPIRSGSKVTTEV